MSVLCAELSLRGVDGITDAAHTLCLFQILQKLYVQLKGDCCACDEADAGHHEEEVFTYFLVVHGYRAHHPYEG